MAQMLPPGTPVNQEPIDPNLLQWLLKGQSNLQPGPLPPQAPAQIPSVSEAQSLYATNPMPQALPTPQMQAQPAPPVPAMPSAPSAAAPTGQPNWFQTLLGINTKQIPTGPINEQYTPMQNIMGLLNSQQNPLLGLAQRISGNVVAGGTGNQAFLQHMQQQAAMRQQQLALQQQMQHQNALLQMQQALQPSEIARNQATAGMDLERAKYYHAQGQDLPELNEIKKKLAESKIALEGQKVDESKQLMPGKVDAQQDVSAVRQARTTELGARTTEIQQKVQQGLLPKVKGDWTEQQIDSKIGQLSAMVQMGKPTPGTPAEKNFNDALEEINYLQGLRTKMRGGQAPAATEVDFKDLPHAP